MIVNSFTHYQTSFKAEEKNEKFRPLSTIQNIVFGWVSDRERSLKRRSDKKDFFHKCDWRDLYKTRSSVATNTAYYGEGFKAWAMRYTHRDRELGTKRFWHVDIGVREENRVATFYARVSFARSQYDLSHEHPAPAVTIPAFIRDILAAKSELRIYSQNSNFGLFPRPVPIKTGSGKHMADWIQSTERRYPMIVFNGNNLKLSREAFWLAGDLVGKAQVLIMDQDYDLADEVKLYLPHSLRIPFGYFRVFYPLNPKDPKPERHRWFDIAAPDYKEQRKGLVTGLLRHFTLEEPRAVTNISEIGRMISFKRLQELADSGSVNEDQVKEVFRQVKDLMGQIDELEEERDGYKAETNQWVSEYSALEDENKQLKAKLHGLSYSQNGTQSTGFDYISELHRLPSTLEEVVSIMARMHGDRLIIADEAFVSAGKYFRCEVVDKAWEMLMHMAGALYELKFETAESIDIARLFEERTGFEYARTEGRQTKANKALCNSRKISVDGKEYEIWPHICHGNREPKMIRIHFAFDDELKKIVIGYVGPHMPNATTRKVG